MNENGKSNVVTYEKKTSFGTAAWFFSLAMGKPADGMAGANASFSIDANWVGPLLQLQTAVANPHTRIS